jgi:hypothetical protein
VPVGSRRKGSETPAARLSQIRSEGKEGEAAGGSPDGLDGLAEEGGGELPREAVAQVVHVERDLVPLLPPLTTTAIRSLSMIARTQQTSESSNRNGAYLRH